MTNNQIHKLFNFGMWNQLGCWETSWPLGLLPHRHIRAYRTFQHRDPKPQAAWGEMPHSRWSHTIQVDLEIWIRSISPSGLWPMHRKYTMSPWIIRSTARIEIKLKKQQLTSACIESQLEASLQRPAVHAITAVPLTSCKSGRSKRFNPPAGWTL